MLEHRLFLARNVCLVQIANHPHFLGVAFMHNILIINTIFSSSEAIVTFINSLICFSTN
ncbi:hypothetical protein NVIRPANT_00960 [Pantoea sp. Nvir]|nr:hypothetical protein NVIRPANT_00960 [Pantoea sp. Nvir]